MGIGSIFHGGASTEATCRELSRPRGAGTRKILTTHPRFSRKFGNLEIWKFGRSLYLNSGGENGFRPQLQIYEIRCISMVRECACVLTSMYLPARLRWKKDPRSFSRRVDHSGYLSGLNLQPSGQRSDVLPAQPSGQLGCAVMPPAPCVCPCLYRPGNIGKKG